MTPLESDKRPCGSAKNMQPSGRVFDTNVVKKMLSVLSIYCENNQVKQFTEESFYPLMMKLISEQRGNATRDEVEAIARHCQTPGIIKKLIDTLYNHIEASFHALYWCLKLKLQSEGKLQSHRYTGDKAYKVEYSKCENHPELRQRVSVLDRGYKQGQPSTTDMKVTAHQNITVCSNSSTPGNDIPCTSEDTPQLVQNPDKKNNDDHHIAEGKQGASATPRCSHCSKRHHHPALHNQRTENSEEASKRRLEAHKIYAGRVTKPMSLPYDASLKIKHYLRNHFMLLCANKGTNAYTCGYCQHKSASREDMNEHIRRVHQV